MSLKTGALALSLGLFAAAPTGVADSEFRSRADTLEDQATVKTVGYRRYKKSRSVRQSLYTPSNRYPSYPDYARQRSMPYGGSAEILELQRRFPQTNWPSSMRYF